MQHLLRRIIISLVCSLVNIDGDKGAKSLIGTKWQSSKTERDFRGAQSTCACRGSAPRHCLCMCRLCVCDNSVTCCTAGHLIKKHPSNLSHNYNCITCSLIHLPGSVWHSWLLSCFQQHHLYFIINLPWKYFLPPPTKEVEFPQKLYLPQVQDRKDSF